MRLILRVSLFFGLACSLLPLFAQPYAVHFATGKVQPAAQLHTLSILHTQAEAEIVNGYYYRLVQCYAIPTEKDKAQWRSQGILIGSYLPTNTFMVGIPFGKQAETALKDARAIFQMEASWKLLPRLTEGGFPAGAWQDGQVRIMAEYVPSATPAMLATWIAAVGGTLVDIDTDNHFVYATAPQNALRTLAASPVCWWIDLAPINGEPDDTRGRAMHRTNLLDSEMLTGRHYNGEGVAVVINDDGFAGPHIDFQGRTEQSTVANDLTGNHGDGTAGIVGAAGNLNPRYRGMATHSFLHIRQYNASMPSTVSLHTQDSVVIFSTSYSDGCNAGYSGTAQKIDNEIIQYPAIMQVFSGGNTGDTDCGYGAGSGWGNITGGHKVSKNSIAVANLGQGEQLEVSSSRGPTADGRLKPDIASHGQGQMSNDSNNAYQSFGGTSAAAPGISGILAQLYQAYRQMHNGLNPPSALMKAALLNTCEDMGNVGPDFQFGWGRVNAFRALRVLEDSAYINGSVGQGGTDTHTITIPANVLEARVMVYWADAAGSPLTTKILVNDLNSSITLPNTTTQLPWLLDYTPTVAALNAPATQGVDSMNNIEQISLINPAAGTYTLTVKGAAVPQGPQEYWVVYTFLTEQLTLTHPVGKEGFVPGALENINWDAVGATGTFTAEYSTDNGQSWKVISSSIPGFSRSFPWNIPSSFQPTDQALVRISRNGVSDVSDSTFTIIAQPTNIKVTQVCSKTADISWSPVPGATTYNVYVLGEKYMELRINTPSTSTIVSGINYTKDMWFAVQACTNSGAKGLRGIAKRQVAGLLNCQIIQDVKPAKSTFTQGTVSDCFADSYTVTAVLKNDGIADEGGFDIAYSLNGGTPVVEMYNDLLLSGTTDTVNFTQKVTLNPGQNTLRIWTILAGDELPENDTIVYNVQSVAGTVITGTHTQTFDAMTTCNKNATCGQVCNLSNGWINENNTTDDTDWRLVNGSTPSLNTGPNNDHTLGTFNGRYLFVNAASCLNKTAALLSPCFNLTGISTPQLSFWYSMYGQDMGELHLDVLVDNVWQVDVMQPLVGDQGLSWAEQTLSLLPYSGKTIQLRFRALTGGGFRSDIALDDINITDITSISESLTTGLSLAPNPNSGLFEVQPASGITPLNCRITDLSGRQLGVWKLSAEGGTIDIRSYPAGLYIAHIQTETGIQAFRVVKQ